MPRVHYVKKARKANKAAGIKKGDSYYWWKFRYGGKQVSKTHPKPSQLTQSEYLSSMYSIQEGVESISGSIQDAIDELRSAKENVEEVMQNCEEKADNLENAFPNGCPSLETLRERIDYCASLIDGLDEAADNLESYADEEEEEDKKEDGMSAEDRIREALDSIDWTF